MASPDHAVDPSSSGRFPGGRNTWPKLLSSTFFMMAALGLLLFSFTPVTSQGEEFLPIWRQIGPMEAAVGDQVTYQYWLQLPPPNDNQTNDVTLTLDLSANVRMTTLESGWFVNEQYQDRPIDMAIRYQTGRGRWVEGPTWNDVSRTAPRTWVASELSLPSGERITQIEITLSGGPDGLRPFSTPSSLISVAGIVAPGGQTISAGDDIRTCGTLTFSTNSAARPLTSCTRTTVQPVAADVQIRFDSNSPSDFIPGGQKFLAFSVVETTPGGSTPADGKARSIAAAVPPGLTILPTGWRVDLDPALPDPAFELSPASAESGQTATWTWPAADGTTTEIDFEENLETTITVIFGVAISETAPAGRDEILAIYRSPFGQQTCWGEQPTSSQTNAAAANGGCLLPWDIVVDRGEEPAVEPTAAPPPTGIDYSDGPEPFPAAWHTITPGVSLGLIVDGETEVQTSFAADGDDLTGQSDEEGIIFGGDGVGYTGQTDNDVTVVLLNRGSSVVRLSGWIDFNRDGQFEAREQIIFAHRFAPAINPQARRFHFAIPADATCGPTLARFRLGSDVSQPDGEAADGEVEDLTYRIDCVADILVAAEPTVTTIGWDETLHWTVTVTNSGPSIAQNVIITQPIGSEVGYLDHAFPSRAGWRCNDRDDIVARGLLTCRVPQIAAGEALTIDLAVVVPRRYPATVVTQTVSGSTATAETVQRNNQTIGLVEVDKRWVLDPRPTRNNFVFVHAAYDPNLTANQDLRERDFRLSEPIVNLIQLPISLAVGYNTGASPWLTVPSCIAHPDDPTCNDNNRIIGQYILQSYTITSITFEGAAVYEPETPTTVFLNRISDANMSRCSGLGSCVGYDLFLAERGGVTPYAWQEPFDYFYVNMVTKGGREVTCPDGYDDRCVIINDARPGIYAVNGTVQLLLVFEDVRLPDETLVRRARPIPFTAALQILAPFVEPER